MPSSRFLLLMVLLLASAFLLGACSPAAPAAVPATATATATVLPPTATATALPPTSTATPTATATDVPPTATATATAIPPTATATATAIPPTATATARVVPPTSTPRPTNTAVNTPIPQPTSRFKVPPGKAGILLQNYIDGKLSFTIQDQQYIVPASPGAGVPGELFILVNPGKATYSANLPNGASTDGTVTTEEGFYYPFPFRYR